MKSTGSASQINPDALLEENTTDVFVNILELTPVLKLIAFALAYFENILRRNMNKI
jgi:hypothetical protein